MMTQLVPVSEWVYHLYCVKFWDKEPHLGGKVVATKHFAASCENHLALDANEAAPNECRWYAWEVVKENVGHPRTIGNLHGLPVVETSLSHGTRLAS